MHYSLENPDYFYRLKFTRQGDNVLIEPHTNNPVDVRSYLLPLFAEREHVTGQDLYDHFDIGLNVPVDELIALLRELTKGTTP